MPETPKEKKELSMETRLLIAFILMGAILFLTPYFYKPPVPPAQKSAPAAKAPPAAQPAATAPAASPELQPPLPPVGQFGAEKEATVVIDNHLYRVVFSNRGAVVRSWVLKKYRDGAGKELDLVDPAGAAKEGFPFALIFPNQKPAADLGQSLYAAEAASDGMGVIYRFSNGKLFSEKSFRFKKGSYLVEISSEVRQGALQIPHLLSWRGGFGDATIENPANSQRTVYFDPAANKLVTTAVKEAKNGPLTHGGAFSFAGAEDQYFAALFLGAPDSSIELRTFNDSVVGAVSNKEEPHIGFAVGGAGLNRYSAYVGPKELETLRKIDPKLEQVVDYGWFWFLAKPLVVALNWVNGRYIHNYGWTIILLTIVINFLLLPLKMSSLRAAKKTQQLQPEIAVINAKYKGLSLRDPRKGEQQQEMMALYKKHGVNPLGGCIPMVPQIPIFFAFFKVLTLSIEMRDASWLWVADLSRPETLPIRILPITMIATQFLLQKMTPNPAADPSQQRMMLLMPVVFGFVMYGFPAGVVLYWLTGNVVGMLQQWWFNRLAEGVPAPAPKPAQKKKGPRS
jgi:YidC/Oxa1 family membrane protein insertase